MPSLDDIEDDCQWIVEKSKERLKQNDKYGAHSWILTAKSLFPLRFIVQYEAFMLHLACEEYQDAAHSLVELCSRFQKEEQLQLLVEQLVDEINSFGQNESKELKLNKVFEMLNPTHQKMTLVNVAESISDISRKGKIIIVVLRLYPDTATTFGLDLYDNLTGLSATDSSRELLVTDLIPLLASSPRINIDQPLLRSSGQTQVLKTSHICQWLEVAANYLTNINMDNRKHSLAGRQAWECLHKIFLTVASKCNWVDILHSKQIGPHLPSKVRWIGLETISGFNASSASLFEAPRQVAIACFYIGVFLFFESAWTYYSHVYQISDDGLARCWALIEEYNPSSEKPTKRKKPEDSNVHLILQTGATPLDVSIVESFVVAINCWNFLHSSGTYRSEFTRLCQQWGAVEWNWVLSFKADMELYKGDIEAFRKVLQRERQKMKPDDKHKLENLRVLLQLVNAYLLLGDTKSACSLATELISLVPDIDGDVVHNPPNRADVPSGRVLSLMCCSINELLPYTIDIITSSVKEIAFSDSCTDVAIGQLMVLSQYKWPKDVDCFNKLILLVQTRGSFTYTKFFKYIINIEMLEEIMYLANQTSVKLNLISLENSSRIRAVTRGVKNKVKEDLTVAMDKQLSRCDESVNDVLKLFLKNEKLCFIGGGDD